MGVLKNVYMSDWPYFDKTSTFVWTDGAFSQQMIQSTTP